MKKTFIGIWNYPNNRPNIQTYALCTFTFSLQTFTIFFLINAFIHVYYIFLTFITPTEFCQNQTLFVGVIRMYSNKGFTTMQRYINNEDILLSIFNS